MKVKFLALALALICIVPAAFAQEGDIETYTYLYNQARTNADQLGLLEVVSEMNLSGMGDFYVMALRRLISEYSNITNVTDLAIADAQAMILAAALGNEKNTAAASDLWQVVDRFRDPIARSEALVALGKIQAQEFLPHVIKVLNDLNDNPAPLDRLYNERIAYAAIIALENYADHQGYLPVYFASVGYYGDWVKEQALRTLEVISSDPAPFLGEIIRNQVYSNAQKYLALQGVEASNIPNETKAEFAATAMAEAYRLATTDVAQRNLQRQIRRLAMTMIGNYGASDDSVYSLLERAYRQGVDFHEKEDAINTLAKLATDDAVRLLSRFLIDLNTRLKDGLLTNEERNYARQIIQALGTIRSRLGVMALNTVIASDWVPVIKTLARDALRQIQSN